MRYNKSAERGQAIDLIFPQRKGPPVQTGGGFPYKGDSPRKIGGPHTENKPERRFSPHRLLRRGRNAAAEARISGNINSAASGRKNAHSSNNFFLRYPPRAMRGGYRRFSEKCRFRRGHRGAASGAGIAGQFPSRAKSSGRPRCDARIAGRPRCGAGENRPFLQVDYTLLQLPAKPPKKLYNRIV